MIGCKHRLLQMPTAYEAELTFQAQLVSNASCPEQYQGSLTRVTQGDTGCTCKMACGDVHAYCVLQICLCWHVRPVDTDS